MVRTQIGRKKLGGHHVCFGDIVRNISKMGVFCSFSEGSLGRVLQKLDFNLSDLKFYQLSI